MCTDEFLILFLYPTNCSSDSQPSLAPAWTGQLGRLGRAKPPQQDQLEPDLMGFTSGGDPQQINHYSPLFTRLIHLEWVRTQKSKCVEP